MVRNLKAPFGLNTEDQNLFPLIEEIAANINNNFRKEEFPEVLKSAWSVVVKTTFINSRTLLVLIREDTDLNEFEEIARDTVNDYVEFDERLTIIISKIKDSRFVEIMINSD